MKKLIVNADDFGQSDGINRGIIKAHEEGIVTSTSLMLRYPAAIQAAEYGKANKALGVGLHLDLGEWTYIDNEWHSLYKVVSLDDDTALRKEISSQVQAFITMMEKTPSHIDSHQHIHRRENIRQIVMSVAFDLNVPVRHYHQDIQYCGDFYGQTEEGLPYHNAIGVEGLADTVSNLTEGTTELACHPGLDDAVNTMYKYERKIEVETLCDPRIQIAIRRSNVELCNFTGYSFSTNNKNKSSVAGIITGIK